MRGLGYIVLLLGKGLRIFRDVSASKCALILQRLILLSAHVLFFWQRNVTYAVQLKRNVGAVQSKATVQVPNPFTDRTRLGSGHTPRPKLFPSNSLIK